jgi:hypothetical protein
MDLWHILVLAIVRHALGTNWDCLEYLANYDLLLRSVMGVHGTVFILDQKIEFNYQTMLDNVSLIRCHHKLFIMVLPVKRCCSIN